MKFHLIPTASRAQIVGLCCTAIFIDKFRYGRTVQLCSCTVQPFVFPLLRTQLYLQAL